MIKTDRDAFEFIKNALLQQQEKSMNSQNDCVYRGYSESSLEEIHDEAYELAYQDFIRNGGDAKDFSPDDHGFNEILGELISETLDNTKPNLRCAVGHIIADRYYDPYLEGKVIDPSDNECIVTEAVKYSQPDWESLFSCVEKDRLNSISLLKRLQALHDTENPESWPQGLDEIEKNFIGNSYLSPIL